VSQHPVVVGESQQVGQTLSAQASRVRSLVPAVGPGAKTEGRYAQPRQPEVNRLHIHLPPFRGLVLSIGVIR